MKKVNWTANLVRTTKAALDEGKDINDIANVLNCSVKAVQCAMWKHENGYTDKRKKLLEQVANQDKYRKVTIENKIDNCLKILNLIEERHDQRIENTIDLITRSHQYKHIAFGFYRKVK